MRKALIVVVAALVTSAAVVLASSSTREGAQEQAAPAWAKNSCRDAVAAAEFARPIGRARPLVARMKTAFGAPGLQLAVAVDGKIVWSRVCGLADVARSTATTRTTLFRIGSVSKTFTATALARLAQSGTVDLDVPVQTYVPTFPEKRGTITLAHLASHQAGIRHYRGGEALSTDRYESITDSLRIVAADPLLFRPGSDYSYSSYGFNLLGAALEGASGERFVEVLRREVFAPLGLEHTRLDVPGVRGRAALYEVRGDRSAEPAPTVDLSDRYPSGGLVSTAEEVARLGSKLGDTSFLSAGTQKTAFADRRPSSGERTGYGLSWEVADTPVGLFVGHTGNVVGGTAFLLAHPAPRTPSNGRLRTAAGMLIGPGVASWAARQRARRATPAAPRPARSAACSSRSKASLARPVCRSILAQL